MRPFEFKIWNNVARQWETGPCEYLHLGPTFVLSDDGEGDVVQYTDVLDSKNNKIWEGDIVNLYGSSLKFEVCFGGFYENGGYYKGWYLASLERDNVGLDDDMGIEVIGNIYENPELLKT